MTSLGCCGFLWEAFIEWHHKNIKAYTYSQTQSNLTMNASIHWNAFVLLIINLLYTFLFQIVAK